MVGHDLPVAGHPHPLQAGGDLDAAPDRAGVDRVVVAVQADVVVPRQPGLVRQPVTGATGGSGSIAARSASIRSAGRHPNARCRRVFASAIHALSWVLKSAGDGEVRPGRNERSR